jgi:hypothetical protein
MFPFSFRSPAPAARGRAGGLCPSRRRWTTGPAQVPVPVDVRPGGRRAVLAGPGPAVRAASASTRKYVKNSHQWPEKRSILNNNRQGPFRLMPGPGLVSWGPARAGKSRLAKSVGSRGVRRVQSAYRPRDRTRGRGRALARPPRRPARAPAGSLVYPIETAEGVNRRQSAALQPSQGGPSPRALAPRRTGPRADQPTEPFRRHDAIPFPQGCTVVPRQKKRSYPGRLSGFLSSVLSAKN